jgi:hypothetical protein
MAGVPSTLDLPRKARLLRQHPHRMRAECRLNTSPHLRDTPHEVSHSWILHLNDCCYGGLWVNIVYYGGECVCVCVCVCVCAHAYSSMFECTE